ncbi:MAG: alpha-amylase/alpha-mannosidase [Deltaproteobacteria bacterium]|nr:alpha-amylase/alpha-mannosidase [Deltaproteobacteria bacterium]
MANRLNIAFLWHMHQPLYKDPITSEYTMPWVLFHATKDYYDMLSILDEFPDVHQTFNLVPCLIDQLNEYASGNVLDLFRKLSQKQASQLTKEDRTFMLQYFFQANWDHMIRPVPRYSELLRKRGLSNTKEEIQAVLRYFVEQDYLDLQVLFNLVWIDPVLREKDPFLTSLYEKGGGYTEHEKKKLLQKQIEIAGTVIPKYKEMMEKGIIEVSTTPYYHPILPLLCDSHSAKEAMPWVTLPSERFAHPEDAERQLRKGVQLYKDTFGTKPHGIWPSEGSVSMDMLPLVAAEGVKWLATDEEILSNSLKRPLRRDSAGNCFDPFLYKPYSIEVNGEALSMVFRDHVLSDLIGFDYSKIDAETAANDFIARLVHIHNMLEEPGKHIVSVILDGENAWEHFRNDGRDFLVSLYSKLSKHSKLSCVTINEFLTKTTYRENLPWLYPGSWISHNFKIWIGHQEDNAAWDYIAEARAALVKYEKSLGPSVREEKAKAIEEAWEEIYAAEGSDWFWWYGEEHSSLSDEHFDHLFRRHIKKIYTLIEMEPPDSLDIPISSGIKGIVPQVLPTALLKPIIDGNISNYFEWLPAGRLEHQYYGSAMHKELQSNGLIEGISFGFSEDALFLRFDYLSEITPYEKEWSFSMHFLHPRAVKLNAAVKGKEIKTTLHEKLGDGKWAEAGELLNIAADAVVELGIPLEFLKVAKGDEIRLVININGGERGLERWPVKGFIIFNAPSEDFEQHDWMV